MTFFSIFYKKTRFFKIKDFYFWNLFSSGEIFYPPEPAKNPTKLSHNMILSDGFNMAAIQILS